MNRGKIVYTGGSYDLFHFGHANFLRQCNLLGHVVVSLNTDEFIEEYKGSLPVMSYKEREGALRSCRYVSDVIPNIGGKDSKPAILKVRPNIVAIGTDWMGKDYYAQMNFTQEWLDKQKIVLVYIPYTTDISTTEIKRRLKSWQATQIGKNQWG